MEEVSLEGTRQGSSAAKAWALSQGSVLRGRPWEGGPTHTYFPPTPRSHNCYSHQTLLVIPPLPQKSLHLQERKFLRLLLILLRLLNSYAHFNTQVKCYPVQ